MYETKWLKVVLLCEGKMFGRIIWIVNEEIYLVHNVDGDAVGGPVDSVSREEVVHMLNEMKTEKVHGPIYVQLN